MITHAVGLSLGANSSIESGIAIQEIATGKLIHLDKLFSMNDVTTFFENYPSIKSSVICVSIPWDNTMLEGKWRVLSKPYQMIHSGAHFPNTDNWMQRFSTRGCELFQNLKSQGVDISRFEVYLTRQALNLYSNYKERSSADCKFLQATLKYEHNFDELPTNMMPVAQLEAIIGTILGIEKLKGNCEKIFEYKELDVINLKKHNV
jgi:predicted nuclease with RNAse H fold